MATITKRTAADGAVSYQVKIRLLGHPQATQSFDRLTDAKRWAVTTEAAIRERRHFRTVEATRHTLADLLDRYTREVLDRRPSLAAKRTAQLAWWRAELGSHLLADVTPGLIAAARDRLAARVTRKGTPSSPATVNRYLAALSHALGVAVKEWGWIDDNPMRKVRRPQEPRGRCRFLSDDERQRLLAACAASPCPDLHPIVVMALSTGMRDMEIRAMTWDRVDLARARVILIDTKNGESRSIPLAGPALDIIKERAARADTALVWPAPRNRQRPIHIRRYWLAALQQADIRNFRFHDLRHSAASYLLMSGASLGELAEILGHKTLAMVKRYSHISEGHARSVLERMNRSLWGSA